MKRWRVVLKSESDKAMFVYDHLEGRLGLKLSLGLRKLKRTPLRYLQCCVNCISHALTYG